MSPTAKVIMETRPQFKVSLKGLEKTGIKLMTPDLQGEQLHFYTTE